jgi:hypothetical protein
VSLCGEEWRRNGRKYEGMEVKKENEEKRTISRGKE